MVCPNCGSDVIRRLPLIHPAGTYKSRGRFFGFAFGSVGGLLFARYRGTSQILVSALSNPPRKLPYASPALLRLIGFFILMSFMLMSFDAQGRISQIVDVLSVVYAFLLPIYLLGTLFYSLFVRPNKFRQWQQKFMCQSCRRLSKPTNTISPRVNARGKDLSISSLSINSRFLRPATSALFFERYKLRFASS